MIRLRSFTLIAICTLSANLRAQKIDSWHVDAVAEEQFNSDNGRWNLSTMLDYGVNVNLWKGAQLNVGALTTYMQHDEDYLSVDKLVFSNLDTQSRLFRFSTLGLSQKVGAFTFFAGVRNTVPDYFTEDEINFFTGSAHGIHPVITENFDVATYPTSALTAQITWQINDNCRLTNTLYNGESGDRLKDEFRLGGGLKYMSAINYCSDSRSFEVGQITGRDNQMRHGTSVYAYDIEHINHKLSLIGELGRYFGYADNNNIDDGETYLCRYFGAVGALYNFDKKKSLGVVGTVAKYEDAYDDTQLEINYAHRFGALMVQPVLIIDNSDGNAQTMGLVRLSLSLGE